MYLTEQLFLVLDELLHQCTMSWSQADFGSTYTCNGSSRWKLPSGHLHYLVLLSLISTLENNSYFLYWVQVVCGGILVLWPGSLSPYSVILLPFLEYISLKSPVKTAILSVAAPPLTTTVYPSTQFSIMLGNIILWTTSLFNNDLLRCTHFVKGNDDGLLDICWVRSPLNNCVASDPDWDYLKSQ